MRQGLAIGLAAAVWVSAPALARDLFTSSLGSDEVLRFDAGTGAFIGAFVSAGSGGLDGPEGMAFGPDGNLYVPAEYSHAIHRFDGTTGAPLAPLATGLSDPNKVVFGSDGTLYYLDHLADRVRRYNVTTSTELSPIMFSDGTHHTHGMTFGPDGKLYVGLVDTSIRRLDPVVLTDMGTFASVAGGASMFGMAFLPDGSLIVTDSFTGSIRRFSGTSGAEMAAFAPAGSISSPFDMGYGPDGLLYVCSGGLGVQRYNPVTGASLGGFITGGSGMGRSPFTPAWTPVPGPGALLVLGLAAAARRRRR